mgnify:CR=1 FL=1|tara:strand:+ start:4855 stop:5361 length:507 start_codon:yes stop_codon:yes gene_type:complete
MKTYNNGPRKGMMYGGAARRKPMMYGGMATTKKKKKMQYGGTANQMSAKKATGQQMPREERKSKNVEPAMGMPAMAEGGKLKMVKNKAGKMVPFYAADGVGKMAYGGETRGDIQDRTKKKSSSLTAKEEETAYIVAKGLADGLKGTPGGRSSMSESDLDRILKALEPN